MPNLINKNEYNIFFLDMNGKNVKSLRTRENRQLFLPDNFAAERLLFKVHLILSCKDKKNFQDCQSGRECLYHRVNL